MTIQVQTKGARVVPDSVFHVAVFGNFSGRKRDFDSLGPLPLSVNSWDQLFEKLAPQVDLTLNLPNIADLKLSLAFASLADFSEKGLIQRIPLLGGIKALAATLQEGSTEAPAASAPLLQAHPALAMVKELASAGSGEQMLDLLSLVDIGEEDDGLSLPLLKAFFQTGRHEGRNRTAILAEVNSVRHLVLDQILKNREFTRLAGMWRALKLLLPFSRKRDDGPILKLELMECAAEDLCDVVFLNYVKPDSAEPRPLDLALFCDPVGVTENDFHNLTHLGRMASALNVPFIMESDPKIFGCNTWSLVSFVKDISGKLAGPAYAKWRKLRDEPGSEWLFLAANPFRVQAQEGEPSDLEPAAPACFLPTIIMLNKLADGLWPSEMLGAWGRVEAQGRPLGKFSEAQINDLAFEGFMPITLTEDAAFLTLEGFTCLGTLKIPPRDQANPANVIEYTLPYRFYSGCCSRFLVSEEGTVRSLEEIRGYTSVKKPEDLVMETSDDAVLYRVKPPFTILGIQPDLILVQG